MPATGLKHQSSTRNNSTIMAPINDAIAAIDARESENGSTLTEIADKFGVDRSTLGRRCKGATTTQEAGYASQQKLNPQQELELVAYIEELTITVVATEPRANP
jgi:transposase-like protein